MENHSRVSFFDSINNTDKEYFYNIKAPVSRNMLNNSSITDQSTSQGGLHKNEWISTVSKESKNALFKGPHNNSKLFD